MQSVAVGMETTMQTAAASARPEHNRRLQEGSSVREPLAQGDASAQRPAGVPLLCTLHGTTTRSSWQWELEFERQPIAAEHGQEIPRASISQTAYGAHFAVHGTREGELIRCGVAQRIPLERVRLRCNVKRTSNAYSSTQQFKALPSRDRKVYEERNGNDQQCMAPTRIRFPVRNVRVGQVSCGISHCIVLAQCGADRQFFAWGHGLYGQLGLGECQSVDVMASIDSVALALLLQHTADAAVELRCGPFSTYVFVKGTSTIVHWGLLPSSDPVDKFVSQGVPVEFPMIDQDVEIADIAAGLEHIVILSSTGHALSWGFGRHGQLGLSHEIIQNVAENAQRVDFFNRDITITSIACGWHHTLALASDKRVFAWGSNRLGACGATTRFHEYFHPVRVTLPSAHDDDLDYTISCCGDTSILMARPSDGALVASYMWGVCSNTLLSLTPVEILDVRHQHPKFVGGKAGFGAAHLLYGMEQGSLTPGSNALVKVAALHLPLAELRHRETSDIALYDLHVGDVFVIRAKLLATMSKSTTDESSPIVSPECVHVSERSASIDDDSNLVELVACAVSSSDGAMEITLKAVAAGSTWLSLSCGDNLMLGSPIKVHIRETEPSSSSTNTISTIGVCVVDTTQKPPQHTSPLAVLADLLWTPALSKRVRMYDIDILLLLLDAEVEPAIEVKPRFSNTVSSAGVRISKTSCECSTFPGKSLVLVRVEFASLGEYAVIASANNAQHQQIAEVVCIMNPHNRLKVLRANREWVKSYCKLSAPRDDDAAAWEKLRMRVDYSSFCSRILSNAQLRDALVQSPWVSTCDQELDACYDVDCEVVNQRFLCSRKSDPFVLWRRLVEALDESESLRSESGAARQSAEDTRTCFWELLPSGTRGDPAIAVFACTATSDSQVLCDPATSELEPSNLDEIARDKAPTAGVMVRQSPLEFLVDKEPMSQPGDEKVITCWRDHHGELYYTAAPISSSRNSPFRIHVYGHESHPFRETAKGSHIGQWKALIHEFLWTVLESRQWNLQTLFQCFRPESSGKDAAPHIRFTDFVTTLQRLGFPSSLATSEYATLFRELEAIAAPKEAKVTLSVLRTFLVDPFHMLTSSVATMDTAAALDALVKRLVQHFHLPSSAPASTVRSKDQRDAPVPWRDFLARLQRFHSSLGRHHLLVSAIDCCRVLYRFDVACDGWIDVHLFLHHVIAALQEHFAKGETTDSSTSATTNRSQQPQRKLAVAVKNAKRPDVDAFSTPNAVHKLFLARAQQQKQHMQRQAKLKNVTKENADDAITKTKLHTLLYAGNTRLAHIRSLPVTKLLGHGVHFRPQHAQRKLAYLYQNGDDECVDAHQLQ